MQAYKFLNPQKNSNSAFISIFMVKSGHRKSFTKAKKSIQFVVSVRVASAFLIFFCFAMKRCPIAAKIAGSTEFCRAVF